MLYARMYINPVTKKIEHCATQGKPFDHEPIEPDGEHDVEDIEMDDHPDGFMRARWILNNMEVRAGRPEFKNGIPVKDKLNIRARNSRGRMSRT